MEFAAADEGSNADAPGRPVPDPGFPGDTGARDPAVAAALAAYAAGEAGDVPTLLALQGSRVLVPVVAVAGEVEEVAGPDGRALAREKSSDMAAVLLRRPDGRTGLLAFTGTETLTAWDADARPVPVTLTDAARAARSDGADALVVDVAGPARFVVQGEDLDALAAGYRLARVRTGDGGERAAWVDPGAAGAPDVADGAIGDPGE